MPFKTRRQKQKAQEHFAKFTEGGEVSYIGTHNAKQTQAIDDEQNLRNKETTLAFEGNIRGEIVKIASLAFAVIGLQIILKISHIAL